MTVHRMMRRTHVTPRMAQVLECIKASPEGATRAAIDAALDMHPEYSRDLLQSLRTLGLVESTGGKYSRWHLAGQAPRERIKSATPWEESPPRRAYKAPGEWKAKIDRANTWHPQA